VGGETLYFVGALGEIVGPGGANVWEVDDSHPLGDQFHPPAGAAAPEAIAVGPRSSLPRPRRTVRYCLAIR
jgi:hypothetical protein